MSGEPLPAWWPFCDLCMAPVLTVAWTADVPAPGKMTARVECHRMAVNSVWGRDAALAGPALWAPGARGMG